MGFPLIDWLTLRLDASKLGPSLFAELSSKQGMLVKSKQGGEIEWRQPTREQIRSDSHQLSWYLNSHCLEIYGSPARVMGGNNVFGERNPARAALQMIRFFGSTIGSALTEDVRQWECTRVDVTLNFALRSDAEVKEALSCLAQTQGGHYRVSTDSATIYWNKRSRLRAGKAYHKGPHLQYQINKRQAEAESWELTAAQRVLRLELALRSQYWRERSRLNWWECSTEELERVHMEYFGAMIGKIEVREMNGLMIELEKIAPSKGAASAAFNTYCAVRADGLENTRNRMVRRTFQRHVALLFKAGLSWADLQSANIVQFRRRTIELGSAVHSWDELLRAAA